MRNIKLKIFSLVCFLGTGCSTSGVLPVGPNTYTIATTNELSPAYAKKQAIKEALAHCNSLGKQLIPTSAQAGSHVDSFGDNIATFDYTFKCLSSSDIKLSQQETKNDDIDMNANHNINSKDPIPSDMYTELKKLDEMRKQGILTESEFQKHKAKILEKY